MKRCPSCNSAFPTDYTHCPRDGSALVDTVVDTDAWGVGTLVRGKYQILAKVGQGGMGSVYKAMHIRFNELRALKVISAELASDAGFVRRFEQEAVMTRKLQHPNAVRVEDLDHAENGRPFIVMEYIEGRNLKDVIEQEAPLAVRRVCSIVKQVAAALDAAHVLGIVHRDIKPANLALVRPDKAIGFRGEQAKVFDFGIAKLKEENLGDNYLTLTGTGVVIGTPAYMSPEQAKGLKGEQLDGRSDLYSLGIVAYQLLTGDLPLKADSTVEQLMAHINTVPKPLHDSWPELEIPDEVSTVVMRCLEKDRELRPASGQALIAELTAAENSGSRSPAHATAAPPNRAASSIVKPSAVKPGTVKLTEVRSEARALKPQPSGTARTRPWVWVAVAALVIAALAGNWWYLRKEHRGTGQEDQQIASANVSPAAVPLKPSKPDAGGGTTIPSVPSAGPATPSQKPAPSTSPSQGGVQPRRVSPAVSSVPNNGGAQDQVLPSNADNKPPSATGAGTTASNTALPDSQHALPPTTPAAQIEPTPGPSKPVVAPTPNEPLPSSENVGERGKAWLDAQKDPPAINVTGAWNSEEWGDFRLTQTQGSRNVSGDSGKYELTGVVSGKRLFLLIHNGGKVQFCATLDSEGDNKLSGRYSYRVTRLRFGHGLCQEKSTPMLMIKR